MILSVIGETDKRPVMYTLLKMCQYLGDVLLITNDRHYARIIEGVEEDVEVIAGHFQNVFIVVTDLTPDEASQAVGYNNDDYEYIIYDNKIDPDGDITIYVAGCEMSVWESEELEYFEEDEYSTIRLGFGKGNIPLTGKMFQNCEIIEGKKILIPVDPRISATLVKLLSSALGVPPKTLEKVVNSKPK